MSVFREQLRSLDWKLSKPADEEGWTLGITWNISLSFFHLFGAHKHSAANVKRAINSLDLATVISRTDGKLHRQLASVVYYEIKTLPDKIDLKFAPRLCRSNVLFKSNFYSVLVRGSVPIQDFNEIRSMLCGFYFGMFSPLLLLTVFDATVSFKVQPTEMTDLRGSRHILLSCSFSAATLNIRERRWMQCAYRK